MNIINDVRPMVGINKFDGVRVDGLQRFGHSELGAFVRGKFVDAIKQRLQRAKSAGVALDDHVQLVAVIFALEQRLFVPQQRVSQRRMQLRAEGRHTGSF